MTADFSAELARQVAGSVAIAASPLAEALGWTVIHATWQGLLAAMLVRAGLRALRDQSAASRYGVAVGGLALATLLPLVTFAWIWWRPESTGALPAMWPVGPGGLDTPGLQRIIPVLGVLWAAGATVAQFRFVAHWWRLRALRSQLFRQVRSVLQDEVDLLCRSMGLRRPVRVVEVESGTSPAVLGGGAPLLLIPTYLHDLLPLDQIRAVLAHELAHVRRHDFAVNVLQRFCESVWFFHPAVWWISERIREEREYCCDDSALVVCDNPLAYARALTTLEEMKRVEPGLALGSTGGPLMKRIQRVVGRRGETRVDGRWLSLAVLGGWLCLSLAALGVGCSEGDGASEATAPANESAAATELGFGAAVHDIHEEKLAKVREFESQQSASGTRIVELIGEDGNVAYSVKLHPESEHFGPDSAEDDRGRSPNVEAPAAMVEAMEKIHAELDAGTLDVREAKHRLQLLHEHYASEAARDGAVVEFAP